MVSRHASYRTRIPNKIYSFKLYQKTSQYWKKRQRRDLNSRAQRAHANWPDKRKNFPHTFQACFLPD